MPKPIHGGDILADFSDSLLKHDPKDKVLRFAVSIQDINNGRHFQAAALLMGLVKEDPQEPRYHSGLATALHLAYSRHHRPELKARAISEYRTYLRLMPKNAKYYHYVQQMIESLETSS